MALTIVDILAEDSGHILQKLIDTHPIIRARIEDRDGTPWLVTDGEPEMCDDLNELLRPFDMSGCLSRIYVSDSHLIIAMHLVNTDATSRRLLIGNIHSLLEGKKVPKDLGFMKISSYEEGASYAVRSESERFYDEMFRDYVPHREINPDPDGRFNSFTYKMEVNTRDLMDYANSNGTTLGSLFMAFFPELCPNSQAMTLRSLSLRSREGRRQKRNPVRADLQECIRSVSIARIRKIS